MIDIQIIGLGNVDEHKKWPSNTLLNLQRRSVLVLQPAVRIFRVVEIERLAREGKRLDGVHHDRQFVGLSFVSAGDNCAGMRAVRNAARMESDGGFLDALAAGKMAANVEEDFIRLNVGMSPRNADGFGMGVQHARSERAHDKSRSVECLMD